MFQDSLEQQADGAIEQKYQEMMVSQTFCLRSIPKV